MAKITFENSSSSSSSSWSILTSSNTSHSIFNRLINIVFKEKKENCSARVQLWEMLSQLESLLLLRFSFTHCLRIFTIKNSVKSFIELLMHPSKKSGTSKLSLNTFFSLLQSSIWFWNYFLSFPINSNFIEKIFAIHLL